MHQKAEVPGQPNGLKSKNYPRPRGNHWLICGRTKEEKMQGTKQPGNKNSAKIMNKLRKAECGLAQEDFTITSRLFSIDFNHISREKLWMGQETRENLLWWHSPGGEVQPQLQKRHTGLTGPFTPTEQKP